MQQDLNSNGSILEWLIVAIITQTSFWIAVVVQQHNMYDVKCFISSYKSQTSEIAETEILLSKI